MARPRPRAPFEWVLLAGAIASSAMTGPAWSEPAERLTAPKGAPVDALDAPRFLGLQVERISRGLDRFGRPRSVTVVRDPFKKVWARIASLFDGGRPFAPGWTVAGAGATVASESISATIQGPDGRRWTLRGKGLSGGGVELTVHGRAHLQHPPRMAEPAPDRRAEGS